MTHVETRDGTRLYVKRWGSGRPVILIHGWPLSADTWDDLALAIAENGMRAIAYDRRGFGRSDQPWDGYTYDQLSDDLADVMAATGATEDVAIIGFSMGGGEVARYMSRHEGRGVTRAGLIGSIVPALRQLPDNPAGAPAEVFEGIKAGIKADRAEFFRGFFRNFFGADTNEVSEGVLDYAWTLAMQAGLRPTLACVDAWGEDFRPSLERFRVPTLVIHGTDDKIVPIDISGRRAAEGIKGAEFREYEGAPHGLLATHQDRLREDVLAFLQR